MNNSLTFELHDRNIDMISKLQRFAYRCLKSFGPEEKKAYSKAEKKEKMELWAKDLFEEYDYLVVFDKTLWFPNQPELYENIVKVEIGMKMSTVHVFLEINFNELTHEIFNVKFE